VKGWIQRDRKVQRARRNGGPSRFDTLEEIAKRDREKAKSEGKLEERKRFIEFIIKNLSKRFGNQLTEEIKDKIRRAG